MHEMLIYLVKDIVYMLSLIRKIYNFFKSEMRCVFLSLKEYVHSIGIEFFCVKISLTHGNDLFPFSLCFCCIPLLPTLLRCASAENCVEIIFLEYQAQQVFPL